MSTKGKEYKLAIRIAGIVDKSFTTSLAAANSSLKATLLSVDKDFNMLDKGFDNVMKLGTKCFSAIASAAGVATLAIGAATAASIAVGSEFESAFAGVKKTVTATDKEFEKLRQDILDMTREIPSSASGIAGVMEIAGQLGIANEYLTDFTKTMINLDVSTNMTAEDAATALAKFANITSMDPEDYERLGSVIVDLGNNFATTEEDIVNMATNLAASGELAGLSEAEIMALSTAFSSVGIAAEAGGSSVSRVLMQMQEAVATGTEDLSVYAETAGMSVSEFASLFKEDAGAAFTSFMDGLGDAGDDAYGILKDLDLNTIRVRKSLLSLAGAEGSLTDEGSLLSEAMTRANEAWGENTALAKEAGERYKTAESQMQFLQNAIQELGIVAYEDLREPYVDVLGTITEKVHDLTDYIDGPNGIGKWIENIGTELPTLQRKFKKYGEPVFEGITSAGKWLVKHGDGAVSVLAGIGGAMAAYKVASSGVHLVKTLTTALAGMNPTTWAILSVVAAIGGLTTAIVAYKQHEAELVNNNLAEHFGSIALSMEDIQQVAEYIAKTESLESVRNALEAFEEVDLSANEMPDLAKELAKLNWKVSIGMGLSESEQGEYKEAITGYVAAAEAYAEQSQYAVHLNLANGLGDESLAAKVNQFYQDSYNEMVSLGESLSNAVNEAFADNILDPEEMDSIAGIQAKMAELQKTLATSEFDAQLSLIGMEYSGGGELTSDSFQNLQLAISEQMEETKKAYDEAYAKNYANIQAAYKAGDYLTDEEYQNAIDNLNQQYAKDVSELEAKAVNFQLDTIMQQYSEELGPVIEKYQKEMGEALNGYGSYDWESDFGESYASMYSWFHDVMTTDALDAETRKALQELLDAMQPSMEQMEETRVKFEELGVDIAEAVQEGFYSYNLLGALANNLGLIGEEGSYLLGQEMGKSGLWNSFYGNMFSSVGKNGLSVPSEINSIKQGVLDVQGIGHRANGGLATRPELTWFAENGPEMAIPIDGSQNAISLWEKTGRLLGMSSTLDGLDLNGGSSGPSIEYSPTLQFYGDAPSRDDLEDALRVSQDEFDSLMERYLKTHGRLAFG